MAADLDFFFDPVCPWAWITSRWVTDVAEQQSYEVNWRFISLWMLNEENTKEWYTPEYRQGHYRGHQALRIADAIRLDPTSARRGRPLVHRGRHGAPRRQPPGRGRATIRWRSSAGCSTPTGSTPV